MYALPSYQEGAYLDICDLNVPIPIPRVGCRRIIFTPAFQEARWASADPTSLSFGWNIRWRGECGYTTLKPTRITSTAARLRSRFRERTPTSSIAAASPRNPPRDAPTITAATVNSRQPLQNHCCQRGLLA